MLNEENSDISDKTWSRALEPIRKNGYMDGAADAQAEIFETNFIQGFDQGLNFGFQLGSRRAKLILENQHNVAESLHQKQSNCLLCTNNKINEKVDNLYNEQEASNNVYLNEK